MASLIISPIDQRRGRPCCAAAEGAVPQSPILHSSGHFRNEGTCDYGAGGSSGSTCDPPSWLRHPRGM